MSAYKYCYTCTDYRTRRRYAIASPLAKKAEREGRGVVEVVDEFMDAAHERHMATGEPLYEGGPTSVLNPFIGRYVALMSTVRSSQDPIDG